MSRILGLLIALFLLAPGLAVAQYSHFDDPLLTPTDSSDAIMANAVTAAASFNTATFTSPVGHNVGTFAATITQASANATVQFCYNPIYPNGTGPADIACTTATTAAYTGPVRFAVNQAAGTSACPWGGTLCNSSNATSMLPAGFPLATKFFFKVYIAGATPTVTFKLHGVAQHN
jgi:hypothetical protein